MVQGIECCQNIEELQHFLLLSDVLKNKPGVKEQKGRDEMCLEELEDE